MNNRAKYEIRQDPNNFRSHPDENKKLIRRSLKECGAGRSIVVDNTGASIGGSGVLEQAKKLGIKQRIVETDGKELVVVVRTDIAPDDPRRKMLALADNATTDQSKWDMEQLQTAFDAEELASWDIDIPGDKDENAELPDMEFKSRYIVEIECDSEESQKSAYEKLTGEGYQCRLLTL